MQVAILLYDGVTALDAIGPYEVLQSPILDIDVRFVAREKGMKRTDFGRLGLMADYTLDETLRPDILLVPGTAYPQAVMGDPQVLGMDRAGAQDHQVDNVSVHRCIGPCSCRRTARAEGDHALARTRHLETIWCDPDERASRPPGQSLHCCRRVLRDRYGAHPGCRRVQGRCGANCPTPHRVRSAAAVRCRQPRQGAVAGRECSARAV